MKDLEFWKGSSKVFMKWPEEAKEMVAFELRAARSGRKDGFSPLGDWAEATPKKHMATELKKMKAIGRHALQLSLKGPNSYRVIYVAKFPEAVYVLHCFQKDREGKQQKDYDTAKQRYKDLERERKQAGYK